jgi:hypothetical protein
MARSRGLGDVYKRQVFVFAAHQMHDLKKEKKKREAQKAKENDNIS